MGTNCLFVVCTFEDDLHFCDGLVGFLEFIETTLETIDLCFDFVLLLNHDVSECREQFQVTRRCDVVVATPLQEELSRDLLHALVHRLEHFHEHIDPSLDLQFFLVFLQLAFTDSNQCFLKSDKRIGYLFNNKLCV